MWPRNNASHQQWFEEDWVYHSRKDPNFVLDFDKRNVFGMDVSKSYLKIYTTFRKIFV